MKKQLVILTLITLLITSSILIQQAHPETIAEPAKLKIYVGPTSVPADNGAYNNIVVQLQDSSGKPARSTQYTTISLSSTQTTIGTVDPTITIQRGTTYGTANFYSTFTPGTTSITATASGYATVQASVTTVAPIPSAIGIYGFPATLPADGGSYDAIMIQLQDSSGSPAKAPMQGIEVTLSSSNTAIGTVNSPITIAGGQTYSIATLTTTTTKGTAIITAVASGYASKQLTITTKDIATTPPNKLLVSVGPPKISADKSTYRQVAIQLLNASSNIAAAPTDITVTIASSDESIGKTETQITIPRTKTYALATITTTYKAGTTTITAVATDFTSDSESITTIGFTPTKLAVYTIPSIMPADNATYQIIQVQLQDSQGRPAKDPEADVNINLFSSEPTVGEVSSSLTIPYGKTHATGTFTAKNKAGNTQITAQASGYTNVPAQITTHVIDFSALKVQTTANQQNIGNGKTTELTTYVTVDGNPITGAKITYTSNNGGTFTPAKEEGQGYYKTTFTAPSFSKITDCTITAKATKTGYIEAQSTTKVTVGSEETTNITGGTIEFCIKDEQDNPMNGTVVVSTSQPPGTPLLISTANSTGYVTFNNAPAGEYSFKISQPGYKEQNITIPFDGQKLALTLMITPEAEVSDYTLMIIISIVATAIVVAALSGFFLLRRRKVARFQELRDLQKSMEKKF